MFWRGAAVPHALFIAGIVAFVVQVGAFALARWMAPRQAIAGWGIGAGLSLATLMVFGSVAHKIGLPLEPALFGMATFLFLTELVEPVFLRS